MGNPERPSLQATRATLNFVAYAVALVTAITLSQLTWDVFPSHCLQVDVPRSTAARTHFSSASLTKYEYVRPRLAVILPADADDVCPCSDVVKGASLVCHSSWYVVVSRCDVAPEIVSASHGGLSSAPLYLSRTTQSITLDRILNSEAPSDHAMRKLC